MTDPLVSPEVDCTDLDCFMLNVEKLMASELVALSSHEVVGAALFLWCRAWKQKPAASLPDDDRVNAAFARLPVARFKKLKAEIMRGFVKCDDGRLYHRTLAECATKASKANQRWKRKEIRRLEIMSGEWASLRFLVFERDEFTCRYCHATGVRLECDHVEPVARGGETVIENLVTACARCNRSKGAKTVEEWLG